MKNRKDINMVEENLKTMMMLIKKKLSNDNEIQESQALNQIDKKLRFRSYVNKS